MLLLHYALNAYLPVVDALVEGKIEDLLGESKSYKQEYYKEIE